MGLGKRNEAGCFLIGSGPSLIGVDITRLARLETIYFNRSYVAWKRWGVAPTYYACFDPIVFEDNAVEIQQLIEEFPNTRFFLPDSPQFSGIEPSTQVSLVRLVPGDTLTGDVFTLTDFGNVGATSIQILALLGYHRIAMVGVDARYSPIGERVALADKDGFVVVADDPDHFCAEYVQGKRLRAIPDLEKILGKWPRVVTECASNEIEVHNASSGSALDCFPVATFESAIEWIRGP